MPLSKARDKERKRLARLEKLPRKCEECYCFQMMKALTLKIAKTSKVVQPDALQSKSKGIGEVTRGKLPVQPKGIFSGYISEDDTIKQPDIDADGNPIPEIT